MIEKLSQQCAHRGRDRGIAVVHLEGYAVLFAAAYVCAQATRGAFATAVQGKLEFKLLVGTQLGVARTDEDAAAARVPHATRRHGHTAAVNERGDVRLHAYVVSVFHALIPLLPLRVQSRQQRPEAR